MAKLPKDKAVDKLDQLYDSIVEEVNNMRELTPFKNIEPLIIKLFKNCFKTEMFNRYYDLLEEIEKAEDGIEELELEEKIEDITIELEGYCYEYVEEKINEYLDTLEESEAEALETELECYLDYIYKELPTLTP